MNAREALLHLMAKDDASRSVWPNEALTGPIISFDSRTMVSCDLDDGEPYRYYVCTDPWESLLGMMVGRADSYGNRDEVDWYLRAGVDEYEPESAELASIMAAADDWEPVTEGQLLRRYLEEQHPNLLAVEETAPALEPSLETPEGVLEWFKAHGAERGLYNEVTGQWVDLWSDDDGISLVTDTAAGWEVVRYLEEGRESGLGLGQFITQLHAGQSVYDSPERLLADGEVLGSDVATSHDLMRMVAGTQGWGDDGYDRILAIHGMTPDSQRKAARRALEGAATKGADGAAQTQGVRR